jgi:hypothetical protein
VTVYVVAVGDAWAGITLYGPFDSVEDAHEWINDDQDVRNGTWNVVPLFPAPPYTV